MCTARLEKLEEQEEQEEQEELEEVFPDLFRFGFGEKTAQKPP
jgi:hypothetical protein